MRLKHVKGAKESLENSHYVLKNAKQYKGKFHHLFQNENPIHVEIGMGKGNFIIEMAKLHPNINFIGMERYDSVLVRAVEKTELLDLSNLYFIRENALWITDIFDHEIDTIYLNFSDPWPKTGHAHRRLTSPEFLNRYNSVYKIEKKLMMKTDNRKLFQYSLCTLSEKGYILKEISLNLYEDQPCENIPTEYEYKFHNLGMPIYRVYAFGIQSFDTKQ